MSRSSIFIILCAVLLPPLYAQGQNQQWTSDQGELSISDWPYSVYDRAKSDSLVTFSEILPLIDLLSMGYDYEVIDGRPFFTFTLSWQPEGRVYMGGEEMAFDDLPGDLYIESLVFQAEAFVEGAGVAMLTLGHDSLMSQASPGQVTFEYADLTWETVMDQTAADSAKAYFLRGFQLDNLQIAEITFVYFEDELASEASSPNAPRRRRASRRTVYQPGISIWVDYPVYRRPLPRRATNTPRTQEPRGSQVGRGEITDEEENRRDPDQRERTRTESDDEEAGKTARDILTGRKKKEKDEEEEDEGDLMPAAVIGAAVVVATAFAGGTIGYFGNTERAPVGLMTGYVQPDGGFLLQLAVNKAVIQRSKVNTEYFVGRLAGFYDLFDSPIQPALGLGVVVSQQNNDVEYDPSVSPGIAGNFGPLLVLGGYDVLQGGLDVGLAYNFRARKE